MALPKSFEAMLKQSDKPVLVDFWAAWCGPCKMMSPVISEVSKELKGKVMVVKVNVDEKQHVAAKYQIQSIPTVILFKNGKEVLRLPGARQKRDLIQAISPHLH
jgi:thioredoxin 1